MTDRLTPAQLAALARNVGALPWRTSMPGSKPVRTVDDLISWVGDYARHAAKRHEALLGEARDNGRAAVVLRGLRRDLENAASTLAELDAAPGGSFRATWTSEVAEAVPPYVYDAVPPPITADDFRRVAADLPDDAHETRVHPRAVASGVADVEEQNRRHLDATDRMRARKPGSPR
jgi:hypothetical protein